MSKLLLLFLVLIPAVVYYTFRHNYNSTVYTYKTVGDLNIDLVVYTPKTPRTTKSPVLFAIHGGGYIFYSKAFGISNQELAEAMKRGWVVVSIDYRLNPSALFPELVEDVQDAYTWVRTELVKYANIDPDLITIMGGSAGGGATVISAFKLTPRPRAVISFYAYCTNWTDPLAYNPTTPVSESLISLRDSLMQNITKYELPSLFKDSRKQLLELAVVSGKGGWIMATHDPKLPVDQVMAILKNYSATYNVDANFPPTYLIHGLNDTSVPYDQSVQLATVLKEKNIPYVLDLVPGANHAFDFFCSQKTFDTYILPAFEFVQKYMTRDSLASLESE